MLCDKIINTFLRFQLQRKFDVHLLAYLLFQSNVVHVPYMFTEVYEQDSFHFVR